MESHFTLLSFILLNSPRNNLKTELCDRPFKCKKYQKCEMIDLPLLVHSDDIGRRKCGFVELDLAFK